MFANQKLLVSFTSKSHIIPTGKDKYDSDRLQDIRPTFMSHRTVQK